VRQLLDRFAGRAFTCEYKYDGERAQVHYIASPPPAAAAAAAAASASNNKPSFSIFSRNSESYTTKFPDVIAALPAAFAPPADGAPAVTSCILDGEVVAVDPETGRIKPFQVLQHRGKKDVNIQDVSIAVAYFLFDILLLNGRSLLHLSLRERREIMHTVFRETPSVRFARGSDSSDVEDIQAFLEQSVAEGCEGLMVKTLDVDARYTPFKRSHSWLKLKKDYMEGVGDTLDLVVLGAYRGKGKRTGVYGGFLLACFDAASEEFQSICKVGTGFSDADLEQLTNALEAHVIDSMRADYRVDSGLKADVWFDAHLVFEIRAADLSLSPVHSAAIGLVDPNRGIALRFPRYLKLRDDKAATDATSAEQVAAMYRSQAVVAEDGAVGGAGAGDVDDACF
jgi:DNA ligase-1